MNNDAKHPRLPRVLFVNSNPFYKLGSHYYSTFSWVKFPELLSQNLDRITLWAPVIEIERTSQIPLQSFLVDTTRLSIVNSGTYQSFSQYLLKLPLNLLRWRREADALVSASDAVVHRVPAPKLAIIVGVAKRRKKPVFLMIAGDVRTQAEPLHGPTFLKRVFYSSIVYILQRNQIKQARYAHKVYAYSGELLNKFIEANSNTTISRTPHISRSSFSNRTDTCDHGEVSLLRVCWLQRSKGLEDLLSAFAELRKRGRDVVLCVVGEERMPGYKKKLEALAADLGVEKWIEFKGWVPLYNMPDLYGAHDIHVVSSLAEGMPRCVTEAGAAGMPQVLTTVGGCPDIMSDGRDALLIPPGQPTAMADAIERIIDDGSLRRSLIRNGYFTAERGTVEFEGKKILDDMMASLPETLT